VIGWKAGVENYRIYAIGSNGKIQRADDAICADDETALTTGLSAVQEYGMAEVWRGAKRLYILSTEAARLKSWNMQIVSREGCSVIAFD